MKKGTSTDIEVDDIQFRLFHANDGTICFDITRYGGVNGRYLAASTHIKDLETASYIFSTLARGCGCDVMNPYEEARYYADSELDNDRG